MYSELTNQIDAEVSVQADETAMKEMRLRQLVRETNGVVVAFSGGVDSAYLAYIASRELGRKAVCVTGVSASLSAHEREGLEMFVQSFDLNHRFVRTDEISNPAYQANSSRRCFFCKDELYSKLQAVALEHELNIVADGSTLDDLGDFRPGREAAQQHGVRSFLIEAGMTKADVREMSRRAALPTWDKPASPCLSSRIAYGTPVTIGRLKEVETGEQILRALGFTVFRVRHHDQLVRLEIARNELDKALSLDMADELTKRFRALGFKYVTLDLQGFRSGAMNE